MADADPLERRLYSAEPSQSRIDRLVILATLHRISIHENGYVVEPIGQLVRANKSRWRPLAQYAQGLGLYSFLPWWARLGLDCVRVWKRLRNLLGV